MPINAPVMPGPPKPSPKEDKPAPVAPAPATPDPTGYPAWWSKAQTAYRKWYTEQLDKLKQQLANVNGFQVAKPGQNYNGNTQKALIQGRINVLKAQYAQTYNDVKLLTAWAKQQDFWPGLAATPDGTPGGDGEGGGGDDEADEQAKRNAADYLIALFKTYGLGELAPEIIKLVQDGVTDAASVTLALSETEAYKKRFAANEIRKQKGYKVYSPAEYLDLEESFRKVLKFNGLPEGFYDQPSDFTNWIAGDTSPDEINDRVSIANDIVLKKDPEYLRALEQMGLNTGDLTAAVLDLKRAFPILKKLTMAAQIGAEANRFGITWSKERADYLQGLGVTQEDARQGYAAIADNLVRAGELGSRFGSAYDQGDLEQDLLVERGSGPASAKRKRIASWEQGLFSGSAGTSKTSFSTRTRGEF